jgi:membrane protein
MKQRRSINKPTDVFLTLRIGQLLLKALSSWWQDDPFTKSAAVAYYSIFSLPGLLILTMGTAAIFFDSTRIENEVIGHLRHILGYKLASNIDSIIDETRYRDRDVLTMLIGLFTLLIGATGVFVQLQRSLNKIWRVKVRKRAAWLDFLMHRATAFGFILAIGFLLTVSLTVTAILAALEGWIAGQIPVYGLYAIHIVHFLVSFFIIALLFSMIFKILPDINLHWKISFAGGILSAGLFVLGEYGLKTYFTLAEPASAFGAAGSIILLMLWVFYSCMILLLGAHFTKVCAGEVSAPVSPTKIAKTA